MRTATVNEKVPEKTPMLNMHLQHAGPHHPHKDSEFLIHMIDHIYRGHVITQVCGTSSYCHIGKSCTDRLYCKTPTPAKIHAYIHRVKEPTHFSFLYLHKVCTDQLAYVHVFGPKQILVFSTPNS